MSYYTHLTIDELAFIDSYLEQGYSGNKIARELGRSPETIHRVLRKRKAGTSSSESYVQYREQKKRCGRKPIELTALEIEYVNTKLQEGWTPDVIVGRGEYPLSCRVSTLYRRFRQGLFDITKLPFKGKRKTNGHKEKRGRQGFTRDLRAREKEHPNFAVEFGHLEGDTIVGKAHKTAIITLVERKTKSIIALKTEGRKATDIEDSISDWLDTIPKNFFKSITFDCGKEFSNWKQISNKYDIDIYFADPGTPAQRGLNENSNGLLRRDGLPKKMDFNEVSKKYVTGVANRRNNIPRKSLDYKTPIECMTEHVNCLELSRLI